MSLKTWMDEFYPMQAESVAFNPLKATKQDDLKMLQHARLKWTGLKPENLKKHGCYKNYPKSIVDDDDNHSFSIAWDTCALCITYMHENPSIVMGERCEGCPLKVVRGMPCDIGTTSYNPYKMFVDLGDPEPMLDLIDQAIARIKDQQPSKATPA